MIQWKKASKLHSCLLVSLYSYHNCESKWNIWNSIDQPAKSNAAQIKSDHIGNQADVGYDFMAEIVFDMTEACLHDATDVNEEKLF